MENSAAWYKNAYRRNVIDMHITADDERFMTEIDPQDYISMLVRGQVQSTVLYAQSHIGLCYFPTQMGKMHPGLKGRDILREITDLCHQEGIGVVIYYSLIFDLWAYRNHPDWKICTSDGKPAADTSRYGVCCPNSPYREYVRQMAAELCTHYDFEGIRFDMTFWPHVCYCHHCQERFSREVGGELPRIIQWDEPHWVAFQRARERWLVEFAEIATSTVRRLKPAASVEHQASTYAMTWRMGVTAALAKHNDFLQGDFYGDALQGSFSRKLLNSLSPNRPSGFETSFGMDLGNYTALKSEELLKCKAAAAMTDGTAFIMIDSIDPVGTLNPLVYERMGRVFETVRPYQAYLGGNPLQDVAIYFSTESKYDPSDNGKHVEDPTASGRMPHVEAALGACKALLDSHIPYGIITRRNLGDLRRFKSIILPNVLMMDSEEVETLREYVQGGGSLYASRYTSLLDSSGQSQKDFLLADVFGVSYCSETKELFTYIAPLTESEPLFGDFSYSRPVGFYTPQVILQARAGAEALAELVLPYTDPTDPVHFASTHNNPPGRWTGSPALVFNHFGKGWCIYSAVDLETNEYCRGLFANLVRRLSGPFTFEATAPKAVEITAFEQPENKRFILSFVNFQKELPNIPADGILVKLRPEGGQPRRVRLLPGGDKLAFLVENDTVVFTIPRLEIFLMVAVEY